MLDPQISPTQPPDKAKLSSLLMAVGRAPSGQSFDSISKEEDKVRIYWKLEIWFKAGLSIVHVCGGMRLIKTG